MTNDECQMTNQIQRTEFRSPETQPRALARRQVSSAFALRHSFVIVNLGNLRLCRRTRPLRHFREWSDTREGSSPRFPSPWPSPSGRGNSAHREWKADGSGLFSAARMVHPLPKGEGWGERKETTAPCRANVVAMARGQCPQDDMALSHSRFQAPGFAGGR